MAKTKAELVARALTTLGVIGAGQIPSVENSNSVSDTVGPLVAQMVANDDLWSFDIEAIPDEVFLPLSEVLANAVADDFGQAFDQGRQDRAMYQIKLLMREDWVKPTLDCDVAVSRLGFRRYTRYLS
jgi:hypothetical protein